MLFTNLKRHKYHFIVVLALLFGSAVSAAMVAARMVYTGRPHYIFLWWNLILAWLPLLLAILTLLWRRRPLLRLASAFLWLIFLPNALYLVTDLMHLRWRDQGPLWFDAIMLFSFAQIGVMLGFASLYLLHEWVERSGGVVAGWLFVSFSMGLSSFGIYVGRFLRWNSWDLLLNPHPVLLDIAHIFRYPQDNLRTFVVSLLLTAVFLFAYMFLIAMPRAAAEMQRSASVEYERL